MLVLGCGAEALFATYIGAQDQDTLYTHFGVQEPVYQVQGGWSGRGRGGRGQHEPLIKNILDERKGATL